MIDLMTHSSCMAREWPCCWRVRGGNEVMGIEAYKFVGPRSLYVLWSNTITETVRIPSTADAVLTNRDGDESTVLPVQMGVVEFEVGVKPVFVEIQKPVFLKKTGF